MPGQQSSLAIPQDLAVEVFKVLCLIFRLFQPLTT